MKRKRILTSIAILFFATAGIVAFTGKNPPADDRFVSYMVDTKKQDLEFYWKDERDETFKSIGKLKSWLEKNKETLVFAMNGGMYKQDHSPQGLFIEKQLTLSALDTSEGTGNFYLKPNGVFYITVDRLPVICNTTKFKHNGKVNYATQSGPMLVIDGQIHSAFKEGSTNLNIRNGVGILPDNRVVFAMSKKEINFYDFARYFKNLGCRNALYLDGFVSRTYLPEQKWVQTDGNFGVIMAVTVTTN